MTMYNKRKIKRSSQFKKDLKLAKKQGKDLSLANNIITKLANDVPLEKKHNDHALSGNWRGYRECHITPDWLLVYKKKDDGELILCLARLASHSELDFD